MVWAIIGVAFIVWLTLVILFTPRIDYRISTPLRPDSDDFLNVIQWTCQARVLGGNRVEILTNGAQFYPAMRDAIRAATASVNLEAYIFRPGEAANLLIDAMVERARAGVEVRLVVDAIGSASFNGEPLNRLRAAGCEVCFYQPIRWYRLHRLNNRTHRELLLVDGRVAFTGGAGVADSWFKGERGDPSWRDTMARVEGPIVGALQGVFAENWLEGGGEILTSPRHWPVVIPAGTTDAMLVKSSPADRATSSRVVFQMLIEGAVADVVITTPYFLPDRSLRRALVRAAQRGVRVRVLVPGPLTDERLVRWASRRMYGELLEGGVRIWEYTTAMMHAKALIIDRTWAVIGTTNVDNRSFEHNDEVNLALRDADITERLCADFASDLAASEEITLEAWQSRPLLERVAGPVIWILERQQ